MIVSFYTSNYIHYAEHLKNQCDQLGINHWIVPRNYGSTWIDNVRAKPSFLLEALNHLKRPFFWLDVDCNLLKAPDFVPEEWGVLLRPDQTPHDFVHYVPTNSVEFLVQWSKQILTDRKGSHSAFIKIATDYEVLPDGYFELGISKNESKTSYFHSHS